MEALILAPIIMILTIFHEISHISSQPHNNPPSAPSCNSSCGNIRIRFPFRLETDPPSCVSTALSEDHTVVLSCNNNLTILNRTTYDGVPPTKYDSVYIVKAINYNNYTVRLVDSNLHKGNCSSIPRPFHFYCDNSFPLETEITFAHTGKFWSQNVHVHPISETVLLLSCEKPVHSTSYINTTPCISNISALEHSNSKSGQYSYAVYGSGFKCSDLVEACQIDVSTLISSRKGSEDDKKKKMITTSYRDLHDELASGFELTWIRAYQKDWDEDLCYVDDKTNEVHCVNTDCGNTTAAQWCRLWKAIDQRLMIPIINPVFDFIILRYKNIVEILAPRTIIGISFVIALIIYKWKRRHLSTYDGIEEFLRNHNNLMPIRYAYSDIRKMTEGFKTKLGEGGFGSVYKGKLRSGHFVAVKMLGKSNTSGQDFINEVATIGRIHHVNIVRLVGFCVEGSKRALVYEFMPNGSLNKYTFSGEETNISLSSEEIFDISLGIARGIDYLHRGCDMQILHFDIKPHNILLDENFIPKVSDFGLARLCPLENSLVSLTAVRGTIGYIAPELFYKNIGGVSHKADVYSFGMLLMEMASRRKNLNADAEHTSQIYFPLWIYDQVNKEKSIELEDVTDQEQKITKKMIVVALWCIQMKPCDRPSMNKVIEMLEDDIECLQMPPKPSFYPQENYNAENAGGTPSTTCPESVLDEDSTD